jgi:carbonic anhydrase
MLRRVLIALLGLIAAGLVAGCGEEEHANWSYHGKTGPSHWGSLDPAYKECSKGKSQSPVDLTNGVFGTPPSIRVTYVPSKVTIENDGHEIEADYEQGSKIKVAGTSYPLTRFHFHAPSEHRINGVSYPLEFHFVHEKAGGSAAAVGVLVQEGAHNPAFDPLLRKLPQHKGDEVHVGGKLNATDLLPRNPDALERWSYNGSLTTPDCDEGIRWTVFNTPIQLSADQLAKLTSVYDDNSRPRQPLNGRKLTFGS